MGEAEVVLELLELAELFQLRGIQRWLLGRLGLGRLGQGGKVRGLRGTRRQAVLLPGRLWQRGALRRSQAVLSGPGRR
ncbi:hypothetical protein [Amycolatopsis sp. NPDC051372]|uniref:hypothetical protein n=1 Tax=Amycolatopsis sp. NPDC051372 TaxID=3155669 RepID=UPI00344047AE